MESGSVGLPPLRPLSGSAPSPDPPASHSQTPAGSAPTIPPGVTAPASARSAASARPAQRNSRGGPHASRAAAPARYRRGSLRPPPQAPHIADSDRPPAPEPVMPSDPTSHSVSTGSCPESQTHSAPYTLEAPPTDTCAVPQRVVLPLPFVVLHTPPGASPLGCPHER